MLVRIGNVEIWRILERVDPFMMPRDFFPDMGEEGLALMRREAPRHLCPETGKLLIPIQGFLVRTPKHVILVDACVGNGKTCETFPAWNGKSDGRFMASLVAAGVGPADIDYVLCTHLHVDHVGWNTQLENGRWVPTFPNARYLLPAADNAHFSLNPGSIYTESVLPVIEAGQAELVGPDHMLGDHVSLISTPGHTPGHVSVRIEDAGQAAVISGDVIHSPIQCWHPEWNFVRDFDKKLAPVTRRAFLERADETGHLVLGTHFPLPSLGCVRASGSAFRWVENR